MFLNLPVFGGNTLRILAPLHTAHPTVRPLFKESHQHLVKLIHENDTLSQHQYFRCVVKEKLQGTTQRAIPVLRQTADQYLRGMHQ